MTVGFGLLGAGLTGCSGSFSVGTKSTPAVSGPDHPPYGLFCVAPGHQLGFNDLKAIEIARYMDAIAGKAEEPFGFRKGLRIQSLVEAIHDSSRAVAWTPVS